MSLLYAGGLWSVFLIFGVSAGYVWALNGPRWAYRALAVAAGAVIAFSWFLPEDHVFRVRVAEGLIWWFWAVMFSIPVGLYVWWVRWLKKKVDQRHDT